MSDVDRNDRDRVLRLMMAALDGEIDGAGRAELDALLRSEAGLRSEWDRLRGLKEVTAMMTLKAQQEVNYLKRVGSPNAEAKRQEVQDWLVLWVFNHLFAGGEAYVSAHLQDFPRDLQVRAVPRGIGISVPLPPLRSGRR